MIKKGLICAIFMIVLLPGVAKTSPGVWFHIYKSQSGSIKLKRDNIRKISLEAGEEHSRLILYILDEQVSYGVERNNSYKRDYEEWIYYAALTASKLHLTEAVPNLKILYENVESPQIKGALLYFIGSLGDQGTVPWLNRLLTYFNSLHREGEIKGKEPVVYGLLRALEFFSHPSSFHPVFYAAVPNYSQQIRETAGRLLESITDDPAPLCMDIIKTEKDRGLVYQALAYAVESKSTDSAKIETAITAINSELDRMYKINYHNETVHRSILDYAVKALGELNARRYAAVEVIEKKWDNDIDFRHQQVVDTNSQFSNINSLEQIATEEAVIVLTKKLLYYIDRAVEAGNSSRADSDRKILVKIIMTLGDLGDNIENIPYRKMTISTVEALELVGRTALFGLSIENDAKLAIDKIVNRLQ